MFQPRPQLEAPYVEVVDRISDAGIRRAGIVAAIDEWQYPFMSLGAQRDPKVEFADVGSALDRPGELPAAIVCLSCPDLHRAILTDLGYVIEPIDAAGVRRGRGEDQLSVELWLRTPR